MLKVLITGAFSTGKTELINDLTLQLRGEGVSVAVTPDVGRNCPMPLNSDQTVESTIWLLTTQVSCEILALGGSAQVLLCDRGVPDVLAHHLDIAKAGRDPEEWIEALAPFLKRWLATYDLILFSQIDETIPIAVDGLRDVDEEYRSRLELLARTVLKGEPAVEVLPFGRLERSIYSSQSVRRLLARSQVRGTVVEA